MTGKPLDPVRRMRWFKEARFGMFVHWGLYSLLGRSEWIMHNEQIPRADYARLADRFRHRGYTVPNRGREHRRCRRRTG